MSASKSWVSILLTMFVATGCGGGPGSGGDTDQEQQKHACSIPCLEYAPTLDKSEIASATGGTVRIGFDIRGDLTNVAEVVVVVNSDVADPFPTTAGYVRIPSPTQVHNEVDIPIPADTPPGGYHVYIAFFAVSPEQSTDGYSVYPAESTEYYTYDERVNGTSTWVLTSFMVPRLEIR